MKVMTKGCAALLCAGGIAAAAQASYVEVGPTVGTGSGHSVTLHFGGNDQGQPASPFDGSTVWAGELKFDIISATGSASFLAGQTINTFCIDIWESATGGETVDTFGVGDAPISGNGVTPMGEDRANLLGSLIGVAGYSMNMMLNGGFTSDATIGGNTYNHNQQAAALQIAIWEIIAEDEANVSVGNLDVSSGAFSVSTSQADTITLANFWLGEAWNAFQNGDFGPPMIAAGGTGFQDMLIIIPLPAPVLMAGIGLLAIPILRRKFRA